MCLDRPVTIISFLWQQNFKGKKLLLSLEKGTHFMGVFCNNLYKATHKHTWAMCAKVFFDGVTYSYYVRMLQWHMHCSINYYFFVSMLQIHHAHWVWLLFDYEKIFIIDVPSDCWMRFVGSALSWYIYHIHSFVIILFRQFTWYSSVNYSFRL